jgi:hypothetical protein
MKTKISITILLHQNLNNAAPNHGHAAPAAAAAGDNDIPAINTPPQSPHAQGIAQNL